MATLLRPATRSRLWLLQDDMPAMHSATKAHVAKLGCLCCHRSVKAAGAFKKSEWGGAIVDSLKPVKEDLVVEGKRGLCGFASTNLVCFEGRLQGVCWCCVGSSKCLTAPGCRRAIFAGCSVGLIGQG